MAEIYAFKRLSVAWMVAIHEDYTKGSYDIGVVNDNRLLVTVKCSSWDDAEKLRRKAEKKLQNRGACYG